jgi:hypothetical protein
MGSDPTFFGSDGHFMLAYRGFEISFDVSLTPSGTYTGVTIVRRGDGTGRWTARSVGQTNERAVRDACEALGRHIVDVQVELDRHMPIY